MKIDKDFAVSIYGEVYTTGDIIEMRMKDGYFDMTIYRKGIKAEINCSIEKVQFLSIPQVHKFERCIRKNTMSGLFNEISRCKYDDEPEMVSPLSCMRQAVKEVMAEKEVMVDMGGVGSDKEIKTDLILDGVKFGKLVFKYNKSTGGD